MLLKGSSGGHREFFQLCLNYLTKEAKTKFVDKQCSRVCYISADLSIS
jgi:hypothetical protein